MMTALTIAADLLRRVGVQRSIKKVPQLNQHGWGLTAGRLGTRVCLVCV